MSLDGFIHSIIVYVFMRLKIYIIQEELPGGPVAKTQEPGLGNWVPLVGS